MTAAWRFWSALHAFPAAFDPFFAEIQEDYDAIESHPGEWPPPATDQVSDDAAEIAASGLFEDIQVRRSRAAQRGNPRHDRAVTRHRVFAERG